MNKHRSLRSTLTGTIVMLTLVSLFAGTSLVIVTNSLAQVSRSLNRSVESIRLTEEAQIALLVHARLRDPLARAQSEASVRQNLQGASTFVATGEESDVLREAGSAAEEYFLATSERPQNPEKVAVRLEKAFRAIERLAEANVAQANDAREEARRLGRWGELITIAAVIVFFIVVPLVLWWLNTRAFRPSFSLARAMTEFASGHWKTRAPETGPAELRAMAAHFNEMADALVKQRESQTAFLAGVAHDLRTPLSALKMSAAAAPADRPLPSEEHVRTILALVDRQVKRLERMVTDFLDTARIEVGELELSIEPHDVRELARNVFELFSDTSPKHRVALELPDAPVWVECDGGRIEQVLNNLMSNAIKYSPEGGEIQISVERRDDRACISVADQGVGIPPADHAQLFEAFHRVKLTGHEIPGVGLGLFVCRRLVEAHEGSIAIASTPGQGSTFTVRLPLARD